MTVMSVMKELAILVNSNQKRGLRFTHYEYGYSSRPPGEVHLVLGILKDDTAVEILELSDEARAKAVVNLLNSDVGYDEDREQI